MKKVYYFTSVSAIIIAAAVGYFTYQRYGQDAQKPTTIESKPGLKTYTSYGGDFSVDYPSTWSTKFSPSVGSDSLQGVSFLDENKTHIGSISMSNSNRSAQEAATLNPKSFKETIDEQGEVTIADRKGYYLKSTAYSEDKNAFETKRSYAVKDGDTLFFISFNEYSNVSYKDIQEPFDNRKYLNDFTYIVKTFRINK